MKDNKKYIKKWLQKADKDLKVAELILNSQPKEFSDIICFHCQQAAEKYFKALLTHLKIKFKKSHDLIYLLDLLSKKIEVPEEIYEKAEIMDDYAVEVRYPMLEDNIITLEDTNESYDGTIKIKSFVLKKIEVKE